MNTCSSKEYRYIFTTTWKQVSASHLSSWLTDNVSASRLRNHLFSCCQLPYVNSQKKNRISLQVCRANVLYFCSFCKPTFSGATFEWDALYNIDWKQINGWEYFWCYAFPPPCSSTNQALSLHIGGSSHSNCVLPCTLCVCEKRLCGIMFQVMSLL
jgi:hypothetical protein